MSAAFATGWREAPALRVAIAALVIGDTLSLAGAPRVVSSSTLFSAALASPSIRWAIVAVGVAAAARFGAGAGRWRAGVVALVALGFLATAFAEVAGGPARNLYFSGVTMLGWIIGILYHRADERFAHAGATALLGAAYLSAGISKLAYSGMPWLDGVQIQAIVLSQDGLVPDGVLAALRTALVSAPKITLALTLATVALELSGPLLLGGRKVRRVVAFGLVGMHTCIFLLGGISYVSAVVLLLVVAFADDAPSHDRSEAPAPRWLMPATVACALAAVFAIAHQAAAAGGQRPQFSAALLPR